MQRSTTLSIPQPCHEAWRAMTPVSGGRFCDGCQKTVVDFTNMSDDEIVMFFQNKPTSTCGRFRNQQLKTYMIPQQRPAKSSYTLLKAGVLSAFVLLAGKHASAYSLPVTSERSVVREATADETRKGPVSEKIRITGTVVDSETGDGLAGVNVVIQGTPNGIATDAQGKFSLEVTPGDILIFSFIGLKTEEYQVPREAGAVASIVMKMSIDDRQIMGGVAFQEAYDEPTSGWSRMWARVKSVF